MTEGVDKNILSLEEKHLIAILMYLTINGECRKIDIYENVSSNPRIPDKLDRLEYLGLITQSRDPSKRSVMVSLTEKGRQVTDLMSQIDKIIKFD